MKASLPEGLGKRVGFGLARSGMRAIADEFSGSARRNLEEMIASETVPGGKESLYDYAKRTGKLAQFEKYRKEELSSGRAYVQQGLHALTSALDVAQDAGEVFDLATTTPIVAIEVGKQVVKVPLDVAVQTAYSAVKGVLGFGSGLYPVNIRGVGQYAGDITKGYVGLAARTIPVIGSIAELTTNMDDVRPRMAKSFAARIYKQLEREEKAKVLEFPNVRRQERDEPLVKEYRGEAYAHDTFRPHENYPRAA